MADLTVRMVEYGPDVLVYPDNLANVVIVLTDLADRVEDVATNTDAGFALRIPRYLWDRFVAYGDSEEGTPVAGNVSDAPSTPKRRGRPPKNRAREV